jgi:uncharacterized phage protein (TIGR01671 family)
VREILKIRAFYNGKMYQVKNICFSGRPTVTLEYNPVLKTNLDNVEIMEDTGYRDNSGNEINTGDIVEISDGVSKIIKATVIFDDLYGAYKVHMFSILVNDDLYKYATDLEYDNPICKIIGNIYENSDLLGGD